VIGAVVIGAALMGFVIVRPPTDGLLQASGAIRRVDIVTEN